MPLFCGVRKNSRSFSMTRKNNNNNILIKIDFKFEWYLFFLFVHRLGARGIFVRLPLSFILQNISSERQKNRNIPRKWHDKSEPCNECRPPKRRPSHTHPQNFNIDSNSLWHCVWFAFYSSRRRRKKIWRRRINVVVTNELNKKEGTTETRFTFFVQYSSNGPHSFHSRSNNSNNTAIL